MTTAIDTNVLIDFVLADAEHHGASVTALVSAAEVGDLLISEIVFAELVPAFPSRHTLERTLQEMGIIVSLCDQNVAYLAGQRWRDYRRARGPRNRILPDFLIGAHAMLHADRLLTRDRGFYRTYFPDLPQPSVTNET